MLNRFKGIYTLTGGALTGILLACTTNLTQAEENIAKLKDIPDELEGIVIEQPVPVAEFKLVNQYDKPFTRESFKGKWSFVFFGYTNCPDICPTTMAELDNAASRLESVESVKDKIQYVFVSIDPDRDTPKQLADYVSYFSSKFVAVTGDKEELKKLATPLRIGFRVGFKTKSSYFMDHGASMILVDPQGQYYARFRPPHYSEEIVSRFQNIMSYRLHAKKQKKKNES